MKKTPILLTGALVGVALLAGCRGADPAPVAASPTQDSAPSAAASPTRAPGSNQPESAPSAGMPESRGPGDFDLADAAAGLDSLPAYRQELHIVFEGQQDGQPVQSETRFTRTRAAEPAADLLALESGESSVFIGSFGQARYHQAGSDQPCTVSWEDPQVQAAAESAPPAELSAMIPAVYGAQAGELGDVDGVPARRYSFDQRAQANTGATESQGELWIAEPGGYVLRYTLQMSGGPETFGPGLSGRQTWEYRLTPLESQAVALPEGCPAVLLEVPALPEAEDVVRLPGYLAYTSAASLQEAAAFYEDQAAILGWTPEVAVEYESGIRRMPYLTAAGEYAEILLRPRADGLQVSVQILEVQ